MPRTPAALNLSVADIHRLIQDRRHALKKLERQRAKLQRKADKLDRRIAALGGTPGRGGRRGSRARNAVSLADAIASVLERAGGGPLGIADLTDKVLAGGYRTNSGNFRSVVNLNLIKDKKRFENVGRGVYRLRNGTAGSGSGKAVKPAARRTGKRAKMAAAAPTAAGKGKNGTE